MNKSGLKGKTLRLKAISKAFDLFMIVTVRAVFLLSIGAIIFAVSLFWIGFHNLDMSQNARVMGLAYNMTLIDTGSDYNDRTMANGYIMGANQMKYGFYLGLVFSFFAGYAFVLMNGVKR